jgi:hypothetical protein
VNRKTSSTSGSSTSKQQSTVKARRHFTYRYLTANHKE